MRRVHNDTTSTSQAVRNLATNPEMVAGVSDKVIRTNLFTNPSFETPGSTFNARTNLMTNPSFEASGGTATVWSNLATNPAFETVGTSPGLWTNLVTNPSFRSKGGTVEVHRNLSTNPSCSSAGSINDFPQPGSGAATSVREFATDKTHNGGTSLKKTITVAGQTGLKFPVERVDVLAGQKVSWGFWIYSTKAGTITLWADGFKTSDGAYAALNAGAKAVPADQWTYVSGTATAALDMYVTAGFGCYGLNVVEGDVVWFDEAMINYGSVLHEYFDGGTVASGDYTYAWNGAAGLSSSVRQGVGVTNAASQRAVAIATTHNGDPALRIKPVSKRVPAEAYYEGNDHFADVRSMISLPLKVNTTYTLLSRIAIETPLSSSGVGLKFRANIDGMDISSPIVPNTVGEHTVRWQFSTGADATVSFFRIMPGSSGIAGFSNEIVLKNLTIVEGIYNGEFFDGTTPAQQNLVKTPATALSGVTITTGVSYAGQTWSRAAVVAGTAGWIARQYVSLADLVNGGTYTASVTVANDTAFATYVALDWSDTTGTGLMIQPGETKRLKVTNARSTHNDIFRFSDLQVNQDASGPRSILFKDWTIERGTTEGLPYTGMGDFTYSWAGTADASTSTQSAKSITGIVANKSASYAPARFFAYQSIDYDTGKKIARWVAPAGTGDSSWRVGGITTAALDYAPIDAGKTYTIHFRYRAKGWKVGDTFRVMMGDATSSNAVISYDVTLPLSSWTWQTYTRTFTALLDATAATILYLALPNVAADTTDGIFDMSDVVITEGKYTGGYFDGATTGDPDLTYAWSGAAHASTSMITGTRAATVNAGNCHAVQSGPVGSKAIRVIPTTTSRDSFVVLPIALENKTYTISATCRLAAPQVGTIDTRARKIGVYHSGGFHFSDAAPNTVGSTRLKVTFTVTDYTAYREIRLYNGVAGGDGDVYWDDVVIEEGVTSGAYFDGTRPAYQNLAVNPSVETNTVNWLSYAGGGGTVTSQRVVDTTSPSGSALYRSIWTTASSFVQGGNYYVFAQAQPDATYSSSMKVRCSKTQVVRMGFEYFRADGSKITTHYGNNVTLQAGVWSEISLVASTAPAGTTKLQVTAYSGSTGASVWEAGDWLDSDSLLLEAKNTLSGNYYEGTGDYTYAWSGTTDASVSYQKAKFISGMTQSYYSNIHQSVEWPTGRKSVRISPNSPISESFFGIVGSFGSLGLFVPGKTYTVSATLRLTAPLSGSLHSRALSLSYRENATRMGYTAGQNVAGTQRLSLTFAVGTDATHGFIELFNGASGGNGDVWWSDVTVVEGGYTGPFFDGSTPNAGDFTYAWSGAANASTSTQRAMDIGGAYFNQRVTMYSSSKAPFSGSSSAKGFVNTVGFFPRFERWLTPIPGRRYTAMVKMKASSGPVQIGIKWATNPDIHGPVLQQAASNGNWTTAKVSSIAPDNATSMAIWIGLPDNTALETELEIDQLMIVSKDYNGPFGTGDSYRWSWEGEPHASTSIGFPVGMMQLAGKPLFVGTTAGTYVLTDIDPAKNPVLAPSAPRTIYTIVNNILDIPTGGMAVVTNYGIDDLSDTIPNTTLTARMQSQADAGYNTILARRTAGAGPQTLNVPSSGRQILITGINENGHLYSAVNKSSLLVDTGMVLNLPHERIKIENNSSYHQHIATYIYPGVHSSAVRQEMVKLLAHEYSIPGM